jgi:hypothetical protein
MVPEQFEHLGVADRHARFRRGDEDRANFGRVREQARGVIAHLGWMTTGVSSNTSSLEVL